MVSEYLTPVANIGDKVLLMTNTGNYLVDVVWVEPIPLLKVTTDTIAAGSTLTREMKEIYVEDNEFAQWRMAIETADVVLTAHNAPEAATYYVTKNAIGELPDKSKYGDEAIMRWQLTEFYQFQDTKRKMTFKNNGSSDTAATIDFYGYVFVFDNPVLYKDLKSVPKPFKPVPCVSKMAGITG